MVDGGDCFKEMEWKDVSGIIQLVSTPQNSIVGSVHTHGSFLDPKDNFLDCDWEGTKRQLFP